MGKKTKFHPLPLTVIRGAAEYCGFKFGAIKQMSLFDDNTQARYIADVEIYPLKLQFKTDTEILAYLADCFAISVTPAWPRRNKNGMLRVDLLIDSKNRSKPSKSNGGGGGGGGVDFDWQDGEDTNCHNENCYYCDKMIADDEVARPDIDGHCWHDRCFEEARIEDDFQDWLSVRDDHID